MCGNEIICEFSGWAYHETTAENAKDAVGGIRNVLTNAGINIDNIKIVATLRDADGNDLDTFAE